MMKFGWFTNPLNCCGSWKYIRLTISYDSDKTLNSLPLCPYDLVKVTFVMAVVDYIHHDESGLDRRLLYPQCVIRLRQGSDIVPYVLGIKMSVRHVQALVMGYPKSGKTTLITRWVTGRLPTNHTKNLPFNGVKSINITSKKHRNKQELVVVRFIDGSDITEDDLRRLCYIADVIVACMCVEVNGLDSQEIKELNNILNPSHRPPIIVLGTMIDLRKNINLLQPVSNKISENGNMAVADNDDHTLVKRLDVDNETNVQPGKLTIENVTKHRVSFSVSKESGDDPPSDTGVMSEGELSDVNERIMASMTESDGNTELDMSSISLDIHNTAVRKKNPAYWSTESINGSLVNKLDESRESWSEYNVEEKLVKDREVAHGEGRGQTFASTSSEGETYEAKEVPVSYPKPLIETHFPLNLDTPLTVKHFPKQWNASIERTDASLKSKIVIPFKDDWFSEDEPDDISFREISSRLAESHSSAATTNLASSISYQRNVHAVRSETEHTTHSTEALLSTIQTSSDCLAKRRIHEGLSASAPPSSVLPEDRNFHVNLDPDPVKLFEHDPDLLDIRVDSDGYCKDWSVADGLRLAKSVDVRGDTYMECSACTGQNIQEVFEYIAKTGCKYNRKKNEKCSIA